MKSIARQIIYLDLFSGTGGFAKGLQLAGFTFKKHYFSEIDKYAAANYQYNFRHAQGLGDIKKISGDQIERPDVITFGSPCQDISIAGDRKGLTGKKSGLFYEAVRLIRIYKPRVFVFENVKGLFSSNKGKDFEAVLQAFADIGLYDLQWQLVNTAWFLPQSRERVYIVGHLNDTARPQIFPLPTRGRLPEKSGGKEWWRRSKDIASTITSTYRKGVHGRGDTYIRAKNRKLRRLTPIECERLQGFVDDWTKYGLFDGEEKEIFDTQRYNMLGNAVSVPAVEAIGRGLLKNKNEFGATVRIYPEQPEVVLGSVVDIYVPELTVSYSRSTMPFLGSIRDSEDVAVFIRRTFNEGEIELQEFFVVLFLNQAREIIGYYRHSKGQIAATMVDTRIVLGTALKCLATQIIIAHNHPSGNNRPSEADRRLSATIKQSCELLNIRLLDHLIITTDNYFSFADNRLLGIETPADKRAQFVDDVKLDLLARKLHNKRSLEKMAAERGISEQNEVKELTELAIVETARSIALEHSPTVREKYDRIVALYNSQVNLSHRTSQSVLLQQYSTPAPIGFMMGIFCGVDKPGIYLEPSAGNGMLTIAGKPEHFYVNEIDDMRHRNLTTQGFRDVISTDANSGHLCSQFNVSRFDAVLTNPPFGMMDVKVKFGDYQIQPLEHVMALRALDCLKDGGKAAIIIGGHTRWDDKDRIQAGKNRLFFNYLYSHYNIADVIQINGRKLYSRQGTSFNTRMILIAGRKPKAQGNAPVFDKYRDAVVNTFDELFTRVTDAMDSEQADEVTVDLLSRFYEENFIPLERKYPAHVLIFHTNDKYEVYDEHAHTLIRLCGLKKDAEFTYKSDTIPVSVIKPEQLTEVTETLRRFTIRYMVIDKLGTSEKLQQGQPIVEHLSTLAKRYIDYLKLQERYNGELVLNRNGDHYEIFGKSATFLARHMDIKLSAQFLYKNETIDLIRLPTENLQWLSGRLRKMNFGFIVIDDLVEINIKTEMDELEHEATALMKRLCAIALGTVQKTALTGSSFTHPFRKRYETYLTLQQHYMGELLLVPYKDFYEVYGRDCGFLWHAMQIAKSAEFEYNGQTVEVTAIPHELLKWVMDKLQWGHFHFVVLDNEHKEKYATLDYHRTDTGIDIWDIPLHHFLTEEKKLHAMLTAEDTYYVLPYRPDYVNLFNHVITNDPRKVTPLNPYTMSIIRRELTSWDYAEACLKSIHRFDVHLALKAGIKIKDAVIKDYPELKTVQDHQEQFNELRPKKDQLNGHP